MRQPPAVATAILHRLGPGDESFVGDLVEEYGGGRSRGYWRSGVLLAPMVTLVVGAMASPRPRSRAACASV